MCLDIGVCALHTVSLEARRSCRRPDKRASDLVGRRVVVGGLNASSPDRLTPLLPYRLCFGAVRRRSASMFRCEPLLLWWTVRLRGNEPVALCIFCVLIADQLFWL